MSNDTELSNPVELNDDGQPKLVHKLVARPRKLPKPRCISKYQLNFMGYVHRFFVDTGWYPSQREVGRQMEISSSATSVGYVTRLESMGMVEWNRTAGIRLTDKGLECLLGKEGLVKYKCGVALDNLKIARKNSEDKKSLTTAIDAIERVRGKRED